MRPDRASAYLHHGLLAGAGEPPNDAVPAPRSAPPGLDHAAAAAPRLPLPGAGLLGIAVAGLALGLLATAIVLYRGWSPGAVSVGPWTASPRIGTTAIDPYTRAELSRSGAVPLAANEGLAFTATTDDTGYRLLRSCSYRVSGTVPAARFWSLTGSGSDGRTIDNAADRAAFTSRDVVRAIAGQFTIEVAPSARPGNWLPLSGQGPLTLTLRLYDTPLAGNAAEVASATLPSLTRLSCTAPGTAAQP